MSRNRTIAVSVITPCYNAEGSLLRTLTSLERQTFRDFEIILVNDGSTDHTADVIEDFLRYTKLSVVYISQENGGVSAARNAGLERATGEFVVFLDADDVYHPDFITTMSGAVKDNNVDTALCCYTRDVDLMMNLTDPDCFAEAAHVSQMDLLSKWMYRPKPYAFTTFIYRKDLIEQHGIRFTFAARYGEDLEFTWKYLSHCRNGVVLNCPLYGYVDNPSSATHSVTWHKTDLLGAIRRAGEYLREEVPAFSPRFEEYMYARTLWAISKAYAQAGKWDLFDRLNSEYCVKKHMKVLAKAPDKRIALSTWLYRTSPTLFYFALRKKRKVV